MGILKNQIKSVLGLGGKAPAVREGALTTSELHYKTKTKSQTSEHSVFDLDGQTPQAYTNPER
jgi:hypothetical protein